MNLILKISLGIIASLLIVGCQGMGGGVKSIGIDIAFTKSEGKPPTRTEVVAWQKAQEWKKLSEGKWATLYEEHGEKKERLLINGTPVNREDYPATVRIFQGGGSCTATVVGPRVLLTAGHCTKNGGTVTFKTYDNKSYSAVMTHAPGYPGNDLDIAIGVINQVVPVKYRSLHTEKNNKPEDSVQLIGYGCTKPGGGGGNDNILRAGNSKITGAQGFDLIIKGGGNAALCYGDSGGPVYRIDNNRVLAVNSKGNIKTISYCTRVYTEQALGFIKSWAQNKGLEVCGVNRECDKDPGPIPGNKEFKFENELIKIYGTIK